MKTIKLIVLFLLVFVFSSCFMTKHFTKSNNKFQTTESGIEYKIVKTEKDAVAPNIGDYLIVDLDNYWTNDIGKDSLLFSSKNIPEDLRIPHMESTYDGSVEEAFALLKIGDSAVFRIDAFTFFTNRNMPLPEFMKEGDKLEFRMTLKDVKTEEELMQERDELLKGLIEEEVKMRDEYIATNNITETATQSGLYYIEIEEGTGKQAVAGNTVSVHYTGSLLNGEIFDSSIKRGEPIEFVLGVQGVIAGWDEGIAMMKVGGKAKLIIPSLLGYGERDMGAIPPFSTLVFEVELVDVFEK